MSRQFCIAALLLAAAGTTIAADDPLSSYQAQAPLSLAAGAGLQRVSLPLALMRHAHSPRLQDVRVFNGDGQPVPMAWAGTPNAPPPVPRRVRLPQYAWPGSAATPAALPELKIEFQSDGSVLRVERAAATRSAPEAAPAAWLLDLQPLGTERPQALRLQWPASPKGQVQPARVMASADAQAWAAAGEATLVEVVDAGGAASVLQQRIELGALAAGVRWLRVQFGSGFALSAVEAEVAPPQGPGELEQARFTLKTESERVWTLDTVALLPVRRLQWHLAQDNSVAPLQLQRREPLDPRSDAPWLDVASHTAYRLQRDGVTLEAPPLDLGGAPTRHWRVRLDERVAPLAMPPQLTLWWRAPQLLFAARGPAPFTLAVGRPQAAPVALERAVLLPGYRDGDEFRLPLAATGTPVVKPAAAPGWADVFTQSTPTQQRRWWLWGMLVLAVGSLGALAWRLARELRRNPEGRNPP